MLSQQISYTSSGYAPPLPESCDYTLASLRKIVKDTSEAYEKARETKQKNAALYLGGLAVTKLKIIFNKSRNICKPSSYPRKARKYYKYCEVFGNPKVLRVKCAHGHFETINEGNFRKFLSQVNRNESSSLLIEEVDGDDDDDDGGDDENDEDDKDDKDDDDNDDDDDDDDDDDNNDNDDDDDDNDDDDNDIVNETTSEADGL